MLSSGSLPLSPRGNADVCVLQYVGVCFYMYSICIYFICSVILLAYVAKMCMLVCIGVCGCVDAYDILYVQCLIFVVFILIICIYHVCLSSAQTVSLNYVLHTNALTM